MKNIAVWFELPVVDMERAEAFYGAVFGYPLRRQTCPDSGLRMSIFDPPGADTKGALVKGEDFTPRADGTLVYLNGGDDLSVLLDRVRGAGGFVLMPKTSIAPNGFIALFSDSEGNRVGLHSLS